MLLADVHRGDVVGVKSPPARQMVEQQQGRAVGMEQGPGVIVFGEQAGQLVAGNPRWRGADHR